MALQAAVLTVSDRSFRGLREDLSGPAVKAALESHGWTVNPVEILPDEQDLIENYLLNQALAGQVDVLLTTGGTGVAPRDVTPEATRAVIDRPVPGISEAIRYESRKFTPHAMLSRGEAGIISRMLIVNLSGSPKAALEQLEVILPVLSHAVELLRNDPKAESGH